MIAPTSFHFCSIRPCMRPTIWGMPTIRIPAAAENDTGAR